MEDHTANDNQRVIEVATAYANRGWHVVPVSGKIPIGGKGWQHLATSDAGEAAALFQKTVADGVGVLLHASALIDLDADSPEAEAAIQAVFEGNIPRTPSFQSTRGIHRLFRWREGWPQQADKAKWMAGPIEVRGISTKAAAQTVFPPSGERRWLVPFTEPVAELTDEILERLTGLANASKPPRKPTGLIVPSYANDNNRLDVPRYLKRVGARVLGQDRTKDGADRWFIECPRRSAHSQRDGEKDCCITQEPDGTLGGHCFHTSCGMSGWQAIRDALGVLTADDFDNTPSVNMSGLMAKMERGGTVAVIDEPDDEPDDELGEISGTVTAADFPKQCLETGGLLGEFIDYTLANSEYPQPELALVCGLALIGAYAGRKVCDATGTRTNIYVMGLDVTGAGKDAARQAASHIMNRTASHLKGAERLVSGAGVLTAVDKSPSQLMLLDEIGYLFEAASNTKRFNCYSTIFPMLMQLYSSSTTTFNGDAYADASRVKRISQPCLSIYGTSTPTVFWRSLTVDSVRDGFLNRWLAFEGRGYQMPREYREAEPPVELLDAFTWWAEFQPSDNPLAAITPQPRVLERSEAAQRRFSEHQLAIAARRMKESEIRAALWSRTAEKAAKLALIHAVSRTRTNPQTIELVDVEFGIALANYATRLFLANCAKNLAENETDANNKRVLRIIDDAGARGLTLSELHKKTQGFKAKDRNEIIQHLEFTGQIVQGQRTSKTKPATVYKTRRHR